MGSYVCRSSNPITNYSTLFLGLAVDGRLDTAALRSSFETLVEEWPMLGGRLLKKRPSFVCGSRIDFSSREVEESLAEYLPIGTQNADKPRILSTLSVAEAKERFVFDTSLFSDSVFKLRVTHLKDASLLCFGTEHCICDGTSVYEIVNAFCNMLSNKPIPCHTLPPDTCGTPLSELVMFNDAHEQDAPNHQENFDIGPLKAAKLVSGLLADKCLESLGLTEKLTDKFVYLPGGWVDQIRQTAQNELGRDPQYRDVQLTRNDIIAAWYLKMVYGSLGPSKAPVDYYGSIDYRAWLRPPEPGTTYLHNSFATLRCKFSVAQLQGSSIAQVALQIRLATQKYATAKSIHQYLRLIEDNYPRAIVFNSRGRGKFSVPGVSPTTAADWAGLDFSGASSEGRRVSVAFAYTGVVLPPAFPLGPVMLTSKDGAGGYWAVASNTPTGWERFDDWIDARNLFPRGSKKSGDRICGRL